MVFNHGDKLLSLLTEYETSRSLIKIQCKCGFIWDTTLQRLLVNKWCIKCSSKERGFKSRKYNLEKVQEIIINKNGILLSEQFNTIKDILHIKCNTCQNDWYASAINICKKNNPTWCPICSDGKTQKLLLDIIKQIFPNETICSNYKSFSWLKNKRLMEIDIWLPNIKLAIEYDGEQHFKPICFGGCSEEKAKLAFKDIKKRDKIKNKQILEHKNEINFFIRFNYKEKYKFTKEYIFNKLKDLNIKDLCQENILKKK